MSTQYLAAISQMIGVILHKRRAALQTMTHDLYGANKSCGFPVPLSAEAVSIGHKPLRCNSGELAQAMQVLKSVGEGMRSDLVEKMP